MVSAPQLVNDSIAIDIGSLEKVQQAPPKFNFKNSCANIKEYIENFKPSLSLREIQEIDLKVQEEFEKLRKYTEELQNEKPKPFYGFSVWKLGCLIGTDTVSTLLTDATIAYSIIASWLQVSEPISVTVLGVSAVAIGVLDYINRNGQLILYFSEEQKGDLILKAYKARDKAQAFKEFIGLYKEIQEQQQKIRTIQTHILLSQNTQDSNSEAIQVSINSPDAELDKKIINCLQRCDQFNREARNTVYEEVLSVLVSNLPDNDPLRLSLEEANQSDTLEQDKEEVVNQYMPHDEENQLDWRKGEQQASLEKSTSLRQRKIFNWKEIQEQLKNRFKIEKEVEYLEVGGRRYSSKGVEQPVIAPVLQTS